MAAVKPLTTEAIALTEKKMDMALGIVLVLPFCVLYGWFMVFSFLFIVIDKCGNIC